MKSYRKAAFTAIVASIMCVTACSPNDNQKSIGNSKDTSSVTGAGTEAIRDTATITQDRKDSTKGKNYNHGNADPSGRVKNQ
ncbi:hypothetical protein [Mucilaginibacter ginkgonis]|uniref:Lipoprotein n=1 Tax=Mucilaginibacter ginkgonis TaxID=2682091 RepID=A0A6I4I2T9_9SPHI|nr:hypothetical protein [Mucilaginibacter ginkgonis]QQL49154.1 hypothetical protein GO620_013345 [Mucilaginibacter ginkgonis]